MRKIIKNMYKLSLVIPFYNEENTVSKLFDQLNSLSFLPKQTELILVDDGSTDHTFEELKKLKTPFSKKVISFSRNFGHQAALLAGLKASSGETVVTLDCDLQHPPQLIEEMLSLHEKGFDVVLTERVDTQLIPWTKRFSSSVFYSLINLLSDTKISRNASDFRSMNRSTLNHLLQLTENRKFLRGLVSWIGFRTATIRFEVAPRTNGTSKYSLLKMMKLALYGVTSFSTAPLYFSALAGLFFFLLAFFYALYVLYVRFFTTQAISGWASVLFVLLVLGGFLSLFLGLLGMYVAAIYDEVKDRPNYIIQETYDTEK